MSSEYSLMDVREAQQRLLENFAPLEAETVALTEARGRILAADISAPYDLPAFSNSAMDGFAVRVEDVVNASPSQFVRLRVVADITAGNIVNKPLKPGTAARIMTGAPVPPGADAVVPVENTGANIRDMQVELPEYVNILNPVECGAHIRIKGEDVGYGDVVLESGCQLDAVEIGFLSMLGISQVAVRRRPRVAILSTGDELVPAGCQLTPGKIYDANSNMLFALVEQLGGEAISLGIVPDQIEALNSTLERAVNESYDLIVSSAGVSVGAFDFVRKVIEEHGRIEFWRVNMRPGKPLAFGYYKMTPLISLPGNPVSAYIGFQVFVRPVIKWLQGVLAIDWPGISVHLAEDFESDGRETYLRVKVCEEDGELFVRSTGHQGSGNLRSLIQANALLFIPSGVKFLKSGAIAKAWMLNAWYQT